MIKRVLFICTGNTCRSPIAEALFQAKDRDIKVRSAGLFKFKGQVSPHALTMLAEYGIHYDHKPQAIHLELVEWANLVLTMTKFHRAIMLAKFPKHTHKIFTLKEYVGDQNSLNISDPVGGTLFRYRQCAQEIDQALSLLEKIIHQSHN